MNRFLDVIRSVAMTVALFKGDTTAVHMLQPQAFQCVATTAFGEARGEGIDGMALVVRSMVNRNRITDRKSCQIARKSYGGYQAMRHRLPQRVDNLAWERAQLVSVAVIAGGIDLGACNDVTHFLNPRDVKKRPLWATRDNQICRIGHHIAYRVAAL